MSISVIGHLGHKVLGRAAGAGGVFDIRFGMALMKDGRVPASRKLMAFGAAAGLVALLIACEVPIEALIGVLLPIIGIGLDVMGDGLEATVGTLLIAALLLPRLLPRELAQQLRAERYGIPEPAPAAPPDAHIIVQ